MAINLESLMYRLLAESESNLFGPRDGRYTVRVVVEGVPNPSMRQSADTLTIVLTPECETGRRGTGEWREWYALYQLGHEIGHVICNPTGHANNLVEGACCVNCVDTVARNKFGDRWAVPNIPPNYAHCTYLVLRLLETDPDALKNLRQLRPNLTQITVDEILQCVAVTRRLAEMLVKPWSTKNV